MNGRGIRRNIRKIISLALLLVALAFLIHVIAGEPAGTGKGLKLWQSLFIATLMLSLIWFTTTFRSRFRETRYSGIDRAAPQPGEIRVRAGASRGTRRPPKRWVLPARLIDIERMVDVGVSDKRYYRKNLKPLLEELLSSESGESAGNGILVFSESRLIRLPPAWRIYRRRLNLHILENTLQRS